MIGIYSSGIWKIPHLQSFLGEECRKLSPLSTLSDEVNAIAVWGERPSAQRPIERAQKAGVPVLRLEDGFTRSLGLGINGTPPLSLVIDDLGIYYNADKPSRLEKLIQQAVENPELEGDAQRAIALMVSNDLSKYNHAPPFTGAVQSKEIVLVVDQTYGDVSVTLGGATERQFDAMLSCAKAEHPLAEIWIKTHPDVVTGKKEGYFNRALTDPHIRIIAENISPQSLLRHISIVYTVTSQYGIEALLAKKRVVCFGLPWYAGWGLTDDRHPLAADLAKRRGRATLTALVSSAWLRYARYIRPDTGTPGTLFDVLDYLILHRTHGLAREGRLWAPGMTLWKSSIVKPYLKTPNNSVNFSRRDNSATACVVWGIRGEALWRQKARQRKIPLWRMEDGFLRSSGLGSDLLPPLSLVLDKTGIYYDATRSNDLETLLNNSQLTPEQQVRATEIQKSLIAGKVSKYNLGRPWQLPPAAKGKRVLLVTGQVEDDASIATGTFSVRTNLGLLQTVRNAHPDAFIIYKPHPDVLVGNRLGHISNESMNNLANHIALDADIIECIQQVDEVHTMTSLSGFEALIHGKVVYCYGMPFYAGWGLTVDLHHCPRRRRKLTLQDIIYQSLISYPTYIHPENSTLIHIENAIELLSTTPKKNLNKNRHNSTRIRRLLRKAINLYKVKFN